MCKYVSGHRMGLPLTGAIRNASSYVAGNVCKQGNIKHELLFSSRFIRFKCCLLLF